MTDIFHTHLGDTPLSENEKLDLIPSLSTQRELNEFEFLNIRAGAEWASSPRRFAKAEITNASYLFELHRRMFNATWRWAGRVRTSEKTIGVIPARIQPDLAVLLGDVNFWIEHETYSPDEIPVRFHHRLVFIHLFPNGNGRHSRLVADLLARKLGRPSFSWGRGTDAPETIRKLYLAALRAADNQDYAALFSLSRAGSL